MERLRKIAIELFLMVAIGVVMALIAPFGSESIAPAQRFFWWVGFMLAGWAVFTPVSRVGEWVADETRVPRWLAVGLTALVGALPLTLVIALALSRIRPSLDWFGAGFPILYAQVAGLALVIHLLMMAIFPGPAPEPVEDRSDGGAENPPFLRRLPPGVGDLLCLEMQDHYVKAHGRDGSAMLLMRLRDAIAELPGAGLQVHRSWWVAHGAVAAIEREGRSVRLRLANGLAVPVSRAFLPAVRAAGWGERAA